MGWGGVGHKIHIMVGWGGSWWQRHLGGLPFGRCKSFPKGKTTRNFFTVQFISCNDFCKRKIGLHVAPLADSLQVIFVVAALNKEQYIVVDTSKILLIYINQLH